MAGLHDLPDLAGEVLSDSGQAFEFFARGDHGRSTPGQIVDCLCRGAIGADAEGIGILDLKQIRKTPEKRPRWCRMTGHVQSGRGARST